MRSYSVGQPYVERMWPAFALVPHCCEDCGVWYWLEWGFRWEVFSQIDGSVSCYRCAGCQRERFAMR